MAIDFDDPAQTTHQGEEIPVNTQEEYDDLLSVVQSMYEAVEIEWSDAAAAQYEARVREGQTPRTIIKNTANEYIDRSGIPVPEPQ